MGVPLGHWWVICERGERVPKIPPTWTIERVGYYGDGLYYVEFAIPIGWRDFHVQHALVANGFEPLDIGLKKAYPLYPKGPDYLKPRTAKSVLYEYTCNYASYWRAYQLRKQKSEKANTCPNTTTWDTCHGSKRA